jgi:hypothetical protein
MREDLIVILSGILLLILFAVAFFGNNIKEGFDDTIINKLQDRTNPLAVQRAPSADPGISESSGSSVRGLAQAALNANTYDASGNAMAFPVNSLSPRIDNENSFLGLVSFCKKTAEDSADSGSSPFSNLKFAEVCGMCMSSGTLVTGENFTRPTGVVVYKEDKENAIASKKENKFRYPRPIPSVNSATCQGALLDDDSKPPTLVISDIAYQDVLKRNECKTQQWYGNACGQCLSDSTSWSFVKDSSQGGGSYETIFWLYGSGNVQVFVGGGAIGTIQALDPTAAIVLSAGVVAEGTPFQIKITTNPPALDASGNPIPSTPQQLFFYGALQSTLPNGKPFYMAIDNLIEVDKVTGSTPRRLTSKFFGDVGQTLTSFVPTILPLTPGQAPVPAQMILDGSIPLTFINADQIAFYDCGASPYVTVQKNGELLINKGDPCLNPPGQGPDTYTSTCLKSRIVSSGCSTGGDWYLKGLPAKATAGKELGKIDKWIAKNRKDSKGCFD